MTKRQTAALILNAAAFVFGGVGIGYRLTEGLEDFFLYYTQLSNIVAVISSAMFIAFRRSENEKLRTFIRGTRYLAACGLTMTFLVVMCFFVPFGTPQVVHNLLGKVNGFLHHLVCPVLSVMSYIFFEDGVKSREAVLIPFIATGIYSFTIYTLNFLRLAGAPYPFFEVYDHPAGELVLWFFGLMALVAGIAFAVRAANMKVGEKEKPFF